MLCCAVACRQGIIFLILNYNHIKATLRAADSGALQRMSSSGTPTAAAAAGRQQQQQQQLQPESPAGRLGLGSIGAAAIKECEVGGGLGGSQLWHLGAAIHSLTARIPPSLPSHPLHPHPAHRTSCLTPPVSCILKTMPLHTSLDCLHSPSFHPTPCTHILRTGPPVCLHVAICGGPAVRNPLPPVSSRPTRAPYIQPVTPPPPRAHFPTYTGPADCMHVAVCGGPGFRLTPACIP